MATKRSVLWSQEMYSPVDLKEKLHERFPVIVMVARGYYGQTEIDTLGSDQVLILQGWSSQKRVVCKDTRGRYISIPTDYPLKFEVTSKTDQDLYLRPVSTRARPLWQIIESHRLPIRVQFDRQVSACFYSGANPRCNETFGHMELLAVYDENYLKGNTINAGKIDTEAITVVPMYMKTHFVIAEGLKGTPPNLWENMRQHYIARVRHLDFQHVNGNMDIMLYDNQLTAGSTDYDLVMPKSYVRHPSICAVSGRFSSEGTIKTVPKCEPKYYPLKTRTASTTEHDHSEHHHHHHQAQHQGHHHQHQAQHHQHQAHPPHQVAPGDGLYTGLTHARPRTHSQSGGYGGAGPVAPPVAYRPRTCNEVSYPSSSSPRTAALAKGGLTTENQGELVQALRNLSVSRQARLSDSSTDSSTTSSSNSTNSEQSSTSPAKSASPSHVPHCVTAHVTNGGAHAGDHVMPGGSPARRPHVPPPRTHAHSESDSGKGSQYTAEDLASSDDSDDVFYNNDDPSGRRKCPVLITRLGALRRNRSESDAVSEFPRGTPAVHARGTNSCSAMDNSAYFSVTRPHPANHVFRSLGDIPSDVSGLSVEEVAECLRLLNLGMYVRKFAEYQVDGELLTTLNHDDMNKEFGISVVIAKKLERFAKHGWRPRLNVSPCASPVKRKQ